MVVLETLFSPHESAAETFHLQRRVCSCGCLSMPDCNRDTLSKEGKTPPSLQEWNGGKKRGTVTLFAAASSNELHNRVHSARSSRNFLRLYYSLLVTVLSACFCHVFVHKKHIPVTPISIVFNLVQLSSCHLMLFLGFPKQKNALPICVMIRSLILLARCQRCKQDHMPEPIVWILFNNKCVRER